MNNNTFFCLAFSHCLGIGPIKFRALLKSFNTPERAYKASGQDLKNIIGEKTASKFIQFRQWFNIKQKFQELEQKKIKIITQLDKNYPQQLINISDPPICLYVRGKINNINLNKEFLFAVVGTRKPTFYGQQIARQFSQQLVDAGVVIVSGMAIGVDTISHRTAIEVGGKTIAVLGCGVDIIYPAINTNLYYQIIKSGGLIISEFPPGHTVLKGLFIARNRIISGLARGVLIIEGSGHSGALITARYAAMQGREVFAPPAPITSEMSSAPNLLLKQGAKLVTTANDIFEEFNLQVKPKTKKDLIGQLPTEERQLVDAVLKQPLSIDELVIALQFSAGKLLSLLSILEIKGIIKKDEEGKYFISIDLKDE